MASEKEIDHFCVYFTGINYHSWEFHLRMYVKGKELWNHFDGVSKVPTDKFAFDEGGVLVLDRDFNGF